MLDHEKALRKKKKKGEQDAKKVAKAARQRNELEHQERREGVQHAENEVQAAKARQAQLERDAKADMAQEFEARGQRAG